MLPDGIEVVGWDIWKGCWIHTTVPRAYANTIETLLGKRGTIQDRHTLAAMDTMTKTKGRWPQDLAHTEWLAELLTEWLTESLTELLTEWLTGWSTDSLS